MGKGQRKVGWAAILLGWSDYGIELVDSWGRWDILSHLPYLGWLDNRWVAPILIFTGMLLIIRAREKEHIAKSAEATKPKKAKKPATNTEAQTSWSWRQILLTLPIASLIAIISAIAMLWFYNPPSPEASLWGHWTPPVDPLAYVEFSEPRPASFSATVYRQTMVENNGKMTGGNIIGNTQIAAPDAPKRQVGIKVDGDLSGNTIKDVTMCHGSDWECVVTISRRYMEKGETDKFEGERQTVPA